MKRWLLAMPVIATTSFSCSGHQESSSSNPSPTAVIVHLPTGGVSTVTIAYDRDGEAQWRQGDLLLRPLAREDDGTTVWIGAFEITRGQWAASGGADQPWNESLPAELFAIAPSPALPAAGLRVARVQRWIDDLNLRLPTEVRCRLPTAEEWRTACTAGGSGPYAWGSSPATATAARYAVVRETSTACQPVGSRSANPAGFYDMHGNVMEWVATAPTGYELRGGSWYHALPLAAADQPVPFDPDIDYGFAGFRVVVELRPAQF